MVDCKDMKTAYEASRIEWQDYARQLNTATQTKAPYVAAVTCAYSLVPGTQAK